VISVQTISRDPRIQPLVAIDVDSAGATERLDLVPASMRGSGPILVGIGRRGSAPTEVVEALDLYLSTQPDRHAIVVGDPEREVARIESAVAANPVAALTMTWLLRSGTCLPVPAAVTMESATYSTLLAGGEFRSWLAARGAPREADRSERVDVTRTGDVLSIRLARPGRRNAVDAALRDALLEALLIAELDTSLRVLITGAGRTFSAGGDIDEFGTATDVAAAHLVRATASVGAAIWRIADRVTVRAHGVCIGAGVEVPAFASRFLAAPGTEFALPEVAMGLIPGAGGTVSIARRIGRHRTLWLALTGARVSADRAFEWGLIDAIE
jgi:hypothetical protein